MLVLGCGTIGIGVVAAAVRKGAMVIAVDIDDSKHDQAKKFGAPYTINSSRGEVAAICRELTEGQGVSVAIEAIGLPETFRLAVEAVAYAGRVVYVGYAKEEVRYDTTHFVRKELDILGSRNALRVFPAVIKMMETADSTFLDLVTRVYPFDEAAQAFRDWDSAPGDVTKILIDVQAAS